MDNATIAAIATPPGGGGIGIIKISGKNALPIAQSLFRPSLSKNRSAPNSNQKTIHIPFKSHHLYHGYIVNNKSNNIIDEVLLTVMLAPFSYTSEDIVEINAHAGNVVLKTILNMTLKAGARLAEPGEFTKRAFLNGRIDLTQAEAVIDVINAKTEKSLQSATIQLSGKMRTNIQSILNVLLDILAKTEAAIDFPEDIDDIIQLNTASNIITKQVIQKIEPLMENYSNAHFIRQGIKVAIAGKPNVGKSSLMNSMIQEDRVIVTPIPGATRDLIMETISINGLPVILCDTAGIHDTSDPIEIIGMRKTEKYINSCDIVLFIVDKSKTLNDDDYKTYNKIKHKDPILVFNKIDLTEKNYELDIPKKWRSMVSVQISALCNTKINELKKAITEKTTGESSIDYGSSIIPNLRQKLSLEKAINAAKNAVIGLEKNMSPEFLSIDIREAIEHLEEVIGIRRRTEILDQIFNKFCLGK
jgi:tRNA modification GTPase